MQHLKIRKIGYFLGVVLPKDLLAQLGIGEGDELVVTNAPRRGLHLAPSNGEVARQMAAAEEIMEQCKNALAGLAK